MARLGRDHSLSVVPEDDMGIGLLSRLWKRFRRRSAIDRVVWIERHGRPAVLRRSLPVHRREAGTEVGSACLSVRLPRKNRREPNAQPATV